MEKMIDILGAIIQGDINKTLKISNELMDEVRFYTEEKTDKYYKGPPPPAWLYDEQANYICYLCTDFYESQELHHFIKRLIRKYRKKQPLSDE